MAAWCRWSSASTSVHLQKHYTTLITQTQYMQHRSGEGPYPDWRPRRQGEGRKNGGGERGGGGRGSDFERPTRSGFSSLTFHLMWYFDKIIRLLTTVSLCLFIRWSVGIDRSLFVFVRIFFLSYFYFHNFMSSRNLQNYRINFRQIFVSDAILWDHVPVLHFKVKRSLWRHPGATLWNHNFNHIFITTYQKSSIFTWH